MPNPLSRVRSNALMSYGPDSLEQRPELALMVIECIARWSHIEAAMGRLLAHMLGAKAAAPAVAMFQSLTSGAARLDALWTAAEVTLDEEYLGYLDAGLRYSRRIANQRHDFAHHIWGACPELPHALLLIDPKEMADLTVRERQILEWNEGEPSGEVFDAIVQGIHLNLDRVMVYRKPDFEAFKKTSHTAVTFWVRLSVMLDPFHGLKPEEIRVLIASPDFQTVLSESPPPKNTPSGTAPARPRSRPQKNG